MMTSLEYRLCVTVCQPDCMFVYVGLWYTGAVTRYTMVLSMVNGQTYFRYQLLCTQVTGKHVHRNRCKHVHKYSCTQVQMYTGTREHLYTGAPVHTYTCTKVHLSTGTPVHRCTCPQVYLSTGTPVHRCTSTQVHLYKS